MKGTGLWLVILLAVVGGAAFGIVQLQGQLQKATYEAKLAQLKLKAKKQAAGLMQLDADTYKREVTSFLRGYYSDLDALAKEFPDQYDIERETKVTAERKKKGGISEENEQGRAERISLA